MILLRVLRSIRAALMPLCPGECRQPFDRCTCSWLPPLPDQYDPDLDG